MSSNESGINEISDKLDKIITLLKISNMDKLTNFKDHIKQDKIFTKIMELCNGTRKYSDIAKEIALELGVAEITVKKKISELVKYGVISIRKNGKESYYNNSGLLD